MKQSGEDKTMRLNVQPRYTIKLWPCEEGGYVVSCDEVPGTVEQGETVQEALENMGEAMSFTLEDAAAN